MSDRDLIQQAPPMQQEPTTAPAVPPEIVPLPEVLRQIGRDSNADAQAYLDETAMPYAGE